MFTDLQKQVFKKVISILKENHITFQVTGGLAAIVYGAKRSLYDIDIDIAKKDIQKIKELFSDYITEDLHHLQNGKFDIYVMTLKIDGVEIDISQAEENYIIDEEGKKIGGDADISNARIMEIDGIEVPVEDKDELISYKRILGRDTDLIDIKQITQSQE